MAEIKDGIMVVKLLNGSLVIGTVFPPNGGVTLIRKPCEILALPTEEAGTKIMVMPFMAGVDKSHTDYYLPTAQIMCQAPPSDDMVDYYHNIIRPLTDDEKEEIELQRVRDESNLALPQNNGRIVLAR